MTPRLCIVKSQGPAEEKHLHLEEVRDSGELRQGSFDYLDMLEDEAILHLRKAAGYSGHTEDVWANFRGVESIGLTPAQGVMVRMLDKVERIKSLLLDPLNNQVGESLDDTLADLSAYARIMRVLLKEASHDPR
jgi:hypothetical protein